MVRNLIHRFGYLSRDFQHFYHVATMEALAGYDDLMNLTEIQRTTRGYRDRKNPLEDYNDKEFVQRYRLSKEDFNDVLFLIQDEIQPVQYRSGYNINAEQKLLTTLRFLATGNYQRVDGDLIGISQPTVSRTVRQVIKEIAKHSREFIKFPSEEELIYVKNQFYQRCGIPCVIGAIDCTQIPIASPGGENAEVFRNRKGFFSINMQAVTDANGCFTNAVCRWPGSTHDSTIFNNSRLCASLEAQNVRGVLLGDNGYQCRRYLLTPFLNPGTERERNYNRAHIRTRGQIERAFGQLKQRFRCLRNGIRLRLDVAQETIVACVCLHNLVRRSNRTADYDDLEIDDVLELENDSNQPVVSSTPAGRTVRNNIVSQYF